MRRLTETCALALRDIMLRYWYEIDAVEYPGVLMFHALRPDLPVQTILVNVRGKDHASWWRKGRREEFGIPLVEFTTYFDMAKSLGVPLYFIFYEEKMKMISYIDAETAMSEARLWEGDDVDVGGTLFVPKRRVTALARLEPDGKIRHWNSFRPSQPITYA